MEDAIDPLEAHRDDGHVEAGGNHGGAGLEPADFALLRPPALGKDEDREAVADEVANISEGLARSGLPLG